MTEMPTSGDSPFFTPPGNFNRPPPPPQQIDAAPNGNDLGHYMKSYIKFRNHRFDARNNLCQ